ncbi:hypothetical protein CONPUDRAFT_30639, partial [Coniophora puteana RWD-64-598 SS2]
DISLEGDIISEWQKEMNADVLLPEVCAVCGQDVSKVCIEVVHADKVPLSLLRNPLLPDDCLPRSYDLLAYDRAILQPEGLLNCWSRDGMKMCSLCRSDLLSKKPKLPKFALANFLYYGHDSLPADVRSAFRDASTVDLTLVARARASRITHVYSAQRVMRSDGEGMPRFMKGNVAVVPQDSTQLRRFLPPEDDELRNSVCVLFSNWNSPITEDVIRRCSPVLARKSVVKTLIEFLLEHNQYYRDAGVQFSQNNLDALFDNTAEEYGFPRAIEVCRNSCSGMRSDTFTSSYSDSERASEFESDSLSDLMLPTIGYTTGDHSMGSKQTMKAHALAYALNGSRFIVSRGAKDLLADDDPCLLSCVFPHLDPWGIGSFNHPGRLRKISVREQLTCMMRLHNSVFVRDPVLPYVMWNVLQKKRVQSNSCFNVSVNVQHQIRSELIAVAPALVDLSNKWRINPRAPASSPLEKRAIAVLKRVQHSASSVVGSPGYKLCRRNEVRSLLKIHGTSALFVTLNPHDLTSVALAASANVLPSNWRVMTPKQRALLVTQRPDAAAIAFDLQVNAFLRIVVRCGQKRPGLFGRCKSYYGMVEAQGRGTLHIHVLLWIEGNPNPQRLRDMMAADPVFSEQMMRWLEHIIKSDLPGSEHIVSKDQLPEARRPGREIGAEDPRLAVQPAIDSMDRDTFWKMFSSFVYDMAEFNNWHEHTDTCFKNLQPGEVKCDDTCRLRMDGSTREESSVDPETGSILLKRWHPWINSYNPVLSFLYQCNNDVKYIGSGEAAKALVYYVTDYITKDDLQLHVGLTALDCAIKRYSAKFDDQPEASDIVKSRSLLTKCVNSIMARREISAQQVMSYLVGGGDCYSSDTFTTLHDCGNVCRYAETDQHPGVGNDVEIDNDSRVDDSSYIYENVDCPEQARLSITQNGRSINVDNQLLDYKLRPCAEEFETMSLYSFVSRFVKSNRQPRRSGGRILRYRLLNDSHHQYGTHVMYISRTSRVPVLLINSIPRRQGINSNEEEYCRMMLVLFRPWRSFADLKAGFGSWCDAFDAYQFKDFEQGIINNM